MDMHGRLTERRAGGLVKVLELWFDDVPDSTRGFDLLVCHQRSAWLHPRRWLYYNTLLFDLTRTPEQLLADTNRTTNREIRKARDQDGVVCGFEDAPDPAALEAFVAYYNANVADTGRQPLTLDGLERYRRAGLLGLCWAKAADGTVLVRRTNVCHAGQGRVRGLFGVSLETADHDLRTLAGRANRLLHHMEMLHYRELGYRVYDFGGWYTGTEDPKRLAINRFKAGFGGRPVQGYDCEQPISLVGWAYYLARLLADRLFRPDRLKERARRRTPAEGMAPDE
jgi:hypothetical protein